LEELKPFLQKQGNPDTLLRSPRDGELYTILYGVEINPRKLNPESLPILAYEQKGVEGTHMVVTVFGLANMSEAELQKSVPAKK
jgi:hypothetical protein